MNRSDLITDLCSSVMVDSSRAWAVLEALGGRIQREESTSKQGGGGHVISGVWTNGHPVYSYRDITKFENLAAFCRYKEISFRLIQDEKGATSVFAVKMDRTNRPHSVQVEGKMPWLTLAAALVKLERN